MRSVKAFILRLVVDPGNPGDCRGALQPLPEGEIRTFCSEAALLTIVRSLAASSSDVVETQHDFPQPQEQEVER